MEKIRILAKRRRDRSLIVCDPGVKLELRITTSYNEIEIGETSSRLTALRHPPNRWRRRLARATAKSPQKGIFSANSSVLASRAMEELLTVLTATRRRPHDDEKEEEAKKRAEKGRRRRRREDDVERETSSRTNIRITTRKTKAAAIAGCGEPETGVATTATAKKKKNKKKRGGEEEKRRWRNDR